MMIDTRFSFNPGDLEYHWEIPKLYPTLFTNNQWEWTMRNRHANGLSDCVVRLNGRKYVDLACFKKWLENQRESNLDKSS